MREPMAMTDASAIIRARLDLACGLRDACDRATGLQCPHAAR
jgi:hypothetical protein